MVKAIFLIGLGVLTSAGAYVIGRRRLGLSRSKIWVAVNKMLQCIGVALVFFAANLAVGVMIVLAGRYLMRSSVSMYIVDDMTLLVLSILQGLTFRWWSEG